MRFNVVSGDSRPHNMSAGNRAGTDQDVAACDSH
jgi:hypothetical protein